MPKLWFSIYDVGSNYDGDEPAFADLSNEAWAKELAVNYATIYEELKKYLAKKDLTAYDLKSMVTKQNSWRTISIRTWGIEQFKNQEQFPFTSAIIKKFPEIVSASFNLLEANSKILPHCGDTNAIYRCHLGLDIPTGLPECGFRVKQEIKPWENGKWLAFMDAYEHEAFNNTAKDRYIFVVDVMRKEFTSEKKYVNSTVRTSLFLQKRWKEEAIQKASPAKVRTLAKLLRPFAQLSISMVNFLKVY